MCFSSNACKIKADKLMHLSSLLKVWRHFHSLWRGLDGFLIVLSVQGQHELKRKCFWKFSGKKKQIKWETDQGHWRSSEDAWSCLAVFIFWCFSCFILLKVKHCIFTEYTSLMQQGMHSCWKIFLMHFIKKKI